MFANCKCSVILVTYLINFKNVIHLNQFNVFSYINNEMYEKMSNVYYIYVMSDIN